MIKAFIPPLLVDMNRDYKPAAAWSLRKLTKTANQCIRVRRDNDDAEIDIGFSGNIIDIAALRTFVGANSGLVVTWYDQSGNGNNATTTVKTVQPRIINTGTLEVNSNGVVALRGLSDNNSRLTAANTASLSIATNLSIFAAHDPETLGGSNLGRIVSKNDTTDYALYIAGTGVLRMAIASNSEDNAYTIQEVNISSVVVNNNSTASYRNNGAAKGTDSAIGAIGTGTSTVSLFNRTIADRGYDGWLNEVILYPFALPVDVVKKIETNMGMFNKVVIA